MQNHDSSFDSAFASLTPSDGPDNTRSPFKSVFPPTGTARVAAQVDVETTRGNALRGARVAAPQVYPGNGAIRTSLPLPAQSVFHEAWWLDLATDGNWRAATVRRGNEIVGEMPYSLGRKGLWRTSQMPPLTRTLGPVLKPFAGDPAHTMLDRIDITTQLIAQIPEVDSFYQIFDPRVEDALAFGLNGFTVSTRYTLQFAPERDVEQLWKGLNGKTRNLIRTAQKFLRVAPIESPAEFNRFYESNLAVRHRSNIYGTELMQRLVSAFVERGAGYLLGAYDANGVLVAAIGVTFDSHAAYYLLSSRSPSAHGGAISVLIWAAIQDAMKRELTFDFDGIPNANTYRFLSGFNPTLKPRLVVERHKPVWSMAKAARRLVLPKKPGWFLSTM
ncbi:GNAT family N-acetyltransferase [Burkholderia sp. S171]|uniref:GNAT family N-acetyltransferase n=1 Tax=Burkholderia sp. S171 TaxID=1641860 RepID=UPI00131DB929|nr:GNAT family N-acetyltransferase [Burkholderia sp. S171]